MKGLVGPLGHVPEDAGLQPGLVQGGLEVNDSGVGILGPVGVGAGAEHQGAREAEVGEQHLPLLLEDRLVLLVLQGEGHVFQGEALHLGAGVPLFLQGDQGGSGGDNGVPGLLRQPVSVPCGAGGRVGQAAGGDDHRPGGQGLAPHHHPHCPAVFQEQMLCPAPEQGNPLPLQGKKQGVDDIGRPV